ncbi:protein spinster isoform X2 [Anabrus simplex]|uniref:protein spinster isoform X2 n=1 Tax=Anabrus simplex TaxID=316456 RepID=UPI0034DD1588
MPAQKLDDRHSLKILTMEPMNLPSNNSHQQLMSTGEDSDSLDTTVPSLLGAGEGPGELPKCRGQRGVTPREMLTVAVLCFVNLINYMDRFTIAGILPEIQQYFGVGDDLGGLLQTAFVLSYMVFAPLFGYLGDRYSRKAIMAFGVFLWSLTTLLGSFMQTYGWFLVFRALVGIGEASYSTIAPTIISDLFIKDMRSKMLALFYFAIPVGSGLGYIVGSEMFNATSIWQWSLRVTPVMGAIAVALILVVMQDPVRGESEGRSHLQSTTYLEDIQDLSRNASFMLSTAGFTCVAFVAGALAWWGPTFIHAGLILQPGNENVSLQEVSFVFGGMAMFAGLIGVPLGSYVGQRWRSKFPRADPIVCGCGLLVSAPLLIGAMLTVRMNTVLCYSLVFLGQLALNLNWAIVADMLLYVVIPTRRSTAEAFQILISHALGDAGSPYMIGVISEALKVSLIPTGVAALTTAVTATAAPGQKEDPLVRFHSLQYALFTTSFVEVLGGMFFLLTALYIVQDKERARGVISAEEVALRSQNSSSDDSVAEECEQPRHLYADESPLTSEQTQNLMT